MNTLLYIIAAILLIGWALGVFIFSVSGGIIHLLLVMAVIAVILGIVRKPAAW